jgi:hypothetical protein
MNINKNNSVIRDNYMLMDAEGICEKEPTEEEIKEFLWTKGWKSDKIKIDYIDFDEKWRWHCRLK